MRALSASYRTALAAILISAPGVATGSGTVSGDSQRQSSAISAPYPGPAATDPEFTLLADLVLASPVILRGTIARARKLSGKAASDVPAGSVRMLVEVDLATVLKAPGLLPARAEWLWQGPVGRDGKPPLRAGQPVLAFLSVPQGGPEPDVVQFRLTAPAAHRPWDGAEEAAVRAIVAAAKDGEGFMVQGVGDGFRVAGAVAGASESQFFLATDAGRPLTLVVTRAPDAAPLVRVATGDVIAATAAVVRPETLLWRALACGLPDDLPERLQADPGLAEDYRLALAGFGDCGRRAFPDDRPGMVSGSKE